MTKNVLDYLYTSKEKFPLKTAVADNVSSMTYTELVDNATTIAVALLKYTGCLLYTSVTENSKKDRNRNPPRCNYWRRVIY